jgi:hypothetical protein
MSRRSVTMSASFYLRALTFADSKSTIGWCWEGEMAWVGWEGLIWIADRYAPRRSYSYLFRCRRRMQQEESLKPGSTH